MCGCEFNVAGAGGTIAGAVHGHFSSRSDISAIYDRALYSSDQKDFQGDSFVKRLKSYNYHYSSQLTIVKYTVSDHRLLPSNS